MKHAKQLALILALAGLSGCSQSTATVTPSPSPSTPLESRCETYTPDMSDPNAIADAAAATLSCHDTATDASPFDATRRAAAWLDPTLTKALPTAAPASADWTEQATHNAYDVVTVEPVIMESEPDTTTSPVIITRLATVTPTGDDGWTGDPEETYYTFTLTQQSEGRWILTDIQI